MKNSKIILQIEKMIGSERTGHAFLLCGGNSASREEAGMWLAERVLCSDEVSHRKFQHGNHEDFIVVEKAPDRESIVKEQILDLLARTEYKPFGDKYAVLIKDAHLMNEISQNKLLKGIEEPVSQVVYILLAEKTEAGEKMLKTAEAFSQLVCGKPCYYKKKAVIQGILSDKDNIRTSALTFLDVLEDRLEEGMLKGDMNKAAAITQLETARKYILQGQSVPYTLKQFCLRV